MKKTLALLLSVLMIVVTVSGGNILSASAANITTNEELNTTANWRSLTSGTKDPADTTTAWHNPTAGTESKGGTTVDTMQLSGATSVTYATKLSVEKNKTYKLSFDYYYSGTLYDWGGKKIVFNTVGVSPLSDGKFQYRTYGTATPVGLSTVFVNGLFKGGYTSGMPLDDTTISTAVTQSADNWYSLTFEFDSAENTELQFYMTTQYLGSGTTIEVTNIKIEEVPEDGVATHVFVEANANNVRGGYLTKNGDSYTANPYKNAIFDGWYDKDGNLITTDATVTPEAWGQYYAARFKTQNLIDESGFESYTNGYKIYDSANFEEQAWTVHNGTKVVPLSSYTTAWGHFYASSAYSKTGKMAAKMDPPWQLVTTKVNLAPNTEYYIGFDWLYTTKVQGTYINDLNYGLFVPDANNANMVAMATGSLMLQALLQLLGVKQAFSLKPVKQYPKMLNLASFSG